MSVAILFDLSRLLSRADRAVPTGIDRVELYYARWLLRHAPSDVEFAAMEDWTVFGAVSTRLAAKFIGALEAAWLGRDAQALKDLDRLARRIRVDIMAGGMMRLLARVAKNPEPPIYLLVSHHHLHRADLIDRLKRRTGARFVALIHDIIPMEYPEYARPGQAARHRQRMETVATLADGIIFNSAATERSFLPCLADAARYPPCIVAPLGIECTPKTLPEPGQDPAPYFIYISTIEPRKNHLLLLHLWRQFDADFGDAAPKLILVGQRGWENENVVDLLERCPGVRHLVREHNRLPDDQLTEILRGARALLLPSFAEGYGLPLAEALAEQVPAIVSDLPALREVGGNVPDYLDPLDGLGWRRAILDYAVPGSPRRAAQLVRLSGWSPPSWDEHMKMVMPFIQAIAHNPPESEQPPSDQSDPAIK